MKEAKNKEFDYDFWVNWLFDWQRKYNLKLNVLDKDSMTLDELNEYSNKLLKQFFTERTFLRVKIASDETILKEFERRCSESFHLWILLDGITIDINRNPGEMMQPIIPLNHQMPLIRALEGKKHIHIEKSRRQGGSLFSMVEHGDWKLLFGKNTRDFTTHKDVKSLYDENDNEDSTLGKMMYQLKNSLFFNRKDLIRTPNMQKKVIIYKNNKITGYVLRPNTAVGTGANTARVDEIDVVSDTYPNKEASFLGGFSAAANRVIFCSTYRSMQYTFYRLKEEHDDRRYDFITLDWHDNPLCNKDWYDMECSKLGRSKILIARELDHNPKEAIPDRVYYRLTDDNFVKDFRVDEGMKKIIMADFGGGTSATALIFAYYSTSNKCLYLHKALKTTQADENDIKNFADKLGFGDVMIVGDRSALSQTGAYKHDWKSLLVKAGFKFRPVNNTKMLLVREAVNLSMMNNEIFVNDRDESLRDLWSYKYKGEGIDKGSASHIGDAVAYGYRFLYMDIDGKVSFG